jgi:hypothetical protein
MEEAEEEGKDTSRPPEDAKKWLAFLVTTILFHIHAISSLMFTQTYFH